MVGGFANVEACKEDRSSVLNLLSYSAEIIIVADYYIWHMIDLERHASSMSVICGIDSDIQLF